jgi:hypothetical protein
MSTTSLYQEMRREWRLFRDDRVGHRFRDHQVRLKNGSLRMRAVSMLFGVVLLVAGVVLCFIPGPGVPVLVFGIALLAGESRVVATLLDRTEPPARRAVHRAGRWWRGLSLAAHIALIAVAVAAGAALAYGAWWFWTR